MTKTRQKAPSRSAYWKTEISKNGGGFWMTEKFTPYEWHGHHIERIRVKKKTKFQEAVIADSSTFGRCLILDGELQSAEKDEFIYHEALIHPALTLHPNPRTVMILGGGEGATLRETLRHPSVKQSTMVDIDGEVVDFAKQYLKTWHQNAFDNPRARVIIDDAKNQIESSAPKSWDVIVSDLPTPVEGGPLQALYTIDFYKTLSKKLTNNGILALQAGSGSLVQIDFHLQLYATLLKVFPLVRPYYAFVPSYDVPWAYFLVSNNRKLDPLEVPAGTIDKKLAERGLRKSLRFYDGQTHVGLFHTPKYIRELLAKNS